MADAIAACPAPLLEDMHRGPDAGKVGAVAGKQRQVVARGGGGDLQVQPTRARVGSGPVWRTSVARAP